MAAKNRGATGSQPHGFRWRGLTTQLFLLLVLPLTAIALIVIFASLRVHQDAMRSLVAARDQQGVAVAASSLSEQIDRRAAGLQNLALRTSETADPGSFLDDSNYLSDEFDSGLAVLGVDGELLDVSGTLNWRQLHSMGYFDGPNLSEAETEPQFFSLFDFPEHGDFIIVGVASAGSRSPRVAGAFSVTFAEQILTQAFPSESAIGISLVDQSHRVLYQTGPVDLEMADYQSALAGETGAVNLTRHGIEFAVAYAPVAPMGWALLTQESWESIESPILRTTQSAPLFLLPIILFALLALGFEARQIVRPLQALRERAAALSWGDFDMINDPVGGIEEIRRLQNELVHMATKLQRAQRGLRGYAGAVVAGQEEERLRLSNELHDETIQSLIVLNQRVQLAELSTQDPKVVEELQRLQTTIDQTIKDLRGIIRALRPPYLEDLGLAASLEMLCRDSSTSFAIPVDFSSIGREIRLKPDAELALYRVTQEALNNMNRHANASHGWVELEYGNRRVRLTIRDNGKGFTVPESPAEFAPTGHYGLLGMHEKAEQIGATFNAMSSPRNGTAIEIDLPLGAATI